MGAAFDPFGDRRRPVLRECRADGCTTSFDDTGRWCPERKVDSGWFHQRRGGSWCPEHTPDWVAEWRERKGSAR